MHSFSSQRVLSGLTWEPVSQHLGASLRFGEIEAPKSQPGPRDAVIGWESVGGLQRMSEFGGGAGFPGVMGVAAEADFHVSRV